VRRARSCRSTPVVLLLPLLLPLFGFPGISDTLSREVNREVERDRGSKTGEREREKER